MKKLILILLLTVFMVSAFASIQTAATAVKKAKAAPLPYGPDAYQTRPKIFRNRSYVVVGAGASTSSATSVVPFSTYFEDGNHHYLFTATELTAAGLTAGTITSVGFNVDAASIQTMNGFNVELKHTTATSVTSFETGFANCYSGTWTAAAGWNDIIFQNTFSWDGTSNLLVKVCFDNDSYTSNSTVYVDDYEDYMTGYAYNDNTHGCTDPYEGNSQTRPQVRFGVVSAEPELTVIPDYGDFSACVGDCSDWLTFTLSNTGTGTIHVDSIAITGTDASEFQMQNNPAPCDLPPSATVDVRFCPTTAGVKNAFLTIYDDRAQTDVPLTGTTIAQGDYCCDPFVVGTLPYHDAGNTSTFNNYTGNSGPDVWYEFVVDHPGNYTMSLCDTVDVTDYDSYLRLYADDCETQVAYNDDFCGYQSQIDCVFLSPGTYYIIIEGYGSNSGNYGLDVWECPPCEVTCDPEAIDEGEPCGDDVNGGCNMETPAFTAVNCGDIICGTVWAEDGIRDTDWFTIDLALGDTLNLTFESEVPIYVGIIEMNSSLSWGQCECDSITGNFYQYTSVGRCEVGTLTFVDTMATGCFMVWVGPQSFESYPCIDGYNDYYIEFDCSVQELPAPTDLTIQMSGTDVLLNWTAVAGATGYNIYRSTDPYNFGGTPYDTSPTNSYTDVGAGGDVKYFYQVTATN